MKSATGVVRGVLRARSTRACSCEARAWPVHLLGSPALRVKCKSVGGDALTEEKAALVATLEDFRARNGFGRGIAAPQIGVTRRFIALNLGDGPMVLADPRIVWRSKETMTLWDDCMSLPWLLCKVRRHRSIGVAFTNESGETEQWDALPEATSELLQHELDHLDGVLITDRTQELTAGAANSGVGAGAGAGADPMVQSIVSREEYERRRADFDAQVDYTIVPTIRGGESEQ